MISIEQAIKEVIIEQDWRLRKEVIHEMIQYWDREGVEGSFPEFLVENFADFWIGKVSRN